MPIIALIPRNERRQMKKIIQTTRDKNYARRFMLMLHRGESVSQVARTLCAGRSSVNRWINWFTLYGLEGLKSLPAGRPAVWNLIPLYPLLSFLLHHSPQQLGCLRYRWSLEFFIIKINALLNIKLPISTFYRYLHKFRLSLVQH